MCDVVVRDTVRGCANYVRSKWYLKVLFGLD